MVQTDFISVKIKTKSKGVIIMANNMDKKNDTKKEGGKGMGNPIAYIKHLMKDPINTIAEADARKKEIMPWLFGSIGVAVVFSVIVKFTKFTSINFPF